MQKADVAETQELLVVDSQWADPVDMETAMDAAGTAGTLRRKVQSR